MVKYSDLVKVKTYEQRKEIRRLESEIKQIKEEILNSFFEKGTKVFYYDSLEDETIKGIVVENRNGTVQVEVNKVDDYEVEKYWAYFNPDDLCKGGY